MNHGVGIFSEFWHGHNWKKRKFEHRKNVEFWHQKIERNIKRDRLVNRTLRRDGWIVHRFWGKDIEKNVERCTDQVMKSVLERKLDPRK